MWYELLSRYLVLPIRYPVEVLLIDFPPKAPFLRQFAVPFTTYSITLGVVVLLGIGEFFLVIGLCLASTERLGNGKHNSLRRKSFSYIYTPFSEVARFMGVIST